MYVCDYTSSAHDMSTYLTFTRKILIKHIRKRKVHKWDISGVSLAEGHIDKQSRCELKVPLGVPPVIQ